MTALHTATRDPRGLPREAGLPTPLVEPAAAPLVDASAAPVLDRLGGLVSRFGLDGLATRMHLLADLSGADMAACERALARVPRTEALVSRAATQLLDLGGKRLRPLCVSLASRVGAGFSDAARECAVAVELVHNATLLHDDVIDLGELRRGAPTARSIYGNAASIFAGDWLLIEALRRVRHAGVEGALDRLLAVIEEMILAESTQLEHRGRFDVDRATYLRVIEGKTGALFRWAMFAGGRAGGLDDARCAALEDYGLHLGMAFQAVDDLLDLAGDEGATGKHLFADLREGKLTFPLIVALECEPDLLAVVREAAASPPDQPIPDSVAARVRAALDRTAALDACRDLARARALSAVASLERVPDCAARHALVVVAEATVRRDR